MTNSNKKGIEVFAQKRGVEIGYNHAETFYILREIVDWFTNNRFRSIPVSCAMATTGKPRKNQCKILDHSFQVKCKDNFPGIHS